MTPRVLARAYRRLGRRYPLAILVLQFQLAHVITAVGIVLLLLYQRMSASEFWRLLAVSQALMLVDNLVSTKVARGLLRPVDLWLRGGRDGDGTERAWRAAAGLPREYFRRFSWFTITANFLPFSVFAWATLDLPGYALPVLLAGGAVVVAYGFLLRFFAIELAMRPILEDVSQTLSDDFERGSAGTSLRVKLLLGIPLINIITGVTVSGFATYDLHGSLANLGLDVAVAVAVALTISLWLTLLLTRSILTPVRDLRAATRRVGEGDLDARVAVVSTDETGGLAQSFNEMVAGLRERQRLHEAFGAFVDPEVAELVLSRGVDVAGEEVEVSVLFLDIRDFTAFAERASAHDVVARLNDFYDRVVPVLLRHGGHANKFVGDGLLGVFGAPDRRPDHADRAVGAALEIAHLVREHYRGDLEIGIGVNSGSVVAGTVGGGGRVEFGVIGDVVNTAARVESLTRETGDEVLITEATRCLLTRDLGAWDERPCVPLKGKTEQVRLWTPRRLAVGSGALDRPSLRGEIRA